MPDQTQRRQTPNEREHREDRERRDHVPGPLGREDRRIGGYVVASVDDGDGCDLENADGRRLSLILSLAKAQQLSESDDNGRDAQQTNTLGGNCKGCRCGGQADRDDDRHPEDLTAEDVDAGVASIRKETDQKKEVVDIRRYEGAGRQQGEREEVHAAAGFLRAPRGANVSDDPLRRRSAAWRRTGVSGAPRRGGAASPSGDRLRRGPN